MTAAPRTVAVIGGGMAGLAAAWELSAAAPSIRVVVFEQQEHLGGKVRTEVFAGRPLDVGPDAFVARRPEALRLCHELGLDAELVAPAARTAYVLARGRLRPLPGGLALGVPTRLGALARSGICSRRGLLRPLLDTAGLVGAPAAGPGGTDEEATPVDRSVGEVVTRRLGPEVAAGLAGPLIGGIHAGDIDEMSAAAVFPALLDADRRRSLMRGLRSATQPSADGGPVFLTVRGGLGRLVEVLDAALRRRGVEVRVGRRVDALERADAARSAHAPGGTAAGGGTWTVVSGTDTVTADAVVVAVPAGAAAALLRPHDAALAATLAGVRYSSVGIVTLRFRPGDVTTSLDGSGFLVARARRGGDGPLVTGCTWLTSKWPALADDDVVVRVSVGRAGDRRHEGLDDETLVRRCLDELRPVMGLRGDALDTLVTRWPAAFPQYAVGHLGRVAAMEAAVGGLPRVAVAGAALHGVGVPACIGSGRRAARAVTAAWVDRAEAAGRAGPADTASVAPGPAGTDPGPTGSR